MTRHISRNRHVFGLFVVCVSWSTNARAADGIAALETMMRRADFYLTGFDKMSPDQQRVAIQTARDSLKVGLQAVKKSPDNGPEWDTLSDDQVRRAAIRNYASTALFALDIHSAEPDRWKYIPQMREDLASEYSLSRAVVEARRHLFKGLQAPRLGGFTAAYRAHMRTSVQDTIEYVNTQAALSAVTQEVHESGYRQASKQNASPPNWRVITDTARMLPAPKSSSQQKAAPAPSRSRGWRQWPQRLLRKLRPRRN